MEYLAALAKNHEMLFFDSSKYDPLDGAYSDPTSANTVLRQARACLGEDFKLNPIAGIKDNQYYCTQLRYGLLGSSDAVSTWAPSLDKLLYTNSGIVSPSTSLASKEDNQYTPYNGSTLNVVLVGKPTNAITFPVIGLQAGSIINPNWPSYSLRNVTTIGTLTGQRNIGNGYSPNQYISVGVLYRVRITFDSTYVNNAAYAAYGYNSTYPPDGNNYISYLNDTGLSTFPYVDSNETVNLDSFLVAFTPTTLIKFGKSAFRVAADLTPGTRPSIEFHENLDWTKTAL